jgi:hypothetical protein
LAGGRDEEKIRYYRFYTMGYQSKLLAGRNRQDHEALHVARGLSSDLQSNIFHLLEVAHAAGGLTTHFYRRSRHLPPGRIAPPKRKQKQPEWIGEALLLAKAYVSNNKQYSQAKLATHIRAELGDRAPDNRRIVIVVSGWQKNGLIPRPL